MTGWLIALGIVAAIALLPLGGSVRYDESGVQIKLILGPVKLLLFPRAPSHKKSGDKSEKKKDEKKNEVAQSPDEAPIPDGPPEGAPSKKLEKPKKGGSLLDFLPLVDVTVDALSALVGRLRVNYLQLHLILGGDDPADLAVNYGRAQAAGAALLAQLDRFLVIKRQDVQIGCDFTSGTTTVLAQVDLTITVGRIISWVVGYGVKALITFLKIRKKQDDQSNLHNQNEGGAAL